jgi:general stress protein YciG
MPDNDKRGGSSNFANDPQKASEAGKKGGERSHGGQKQHEQTNKDQGRQQSGTGGEQKGGSGGGKTGQR